MTSYDSVVTMAMDRQLGDVAGLWLPRQLCRDVYKSSVTSGTWTFLGGKLSLVSCLTMQVGAVER